MKMEKNKKYEDSSQCMKEVKHRVLKLIENWENERLVAGIINIDGMVRREYFGQLEKLMCQPRVIGRHIKRTQMLFKIQTQHSVRELPEN